jgi:DNA-binding NarL/FixJ family response regulator
LAYREAMSAAMTVSEAELCVRTHLENIFSRLQVTNRTAAVLHAFPDQVA